MREELRAVGKRGSGRRGCLQGDSLRKASRRAPDNALYIVANALALPRELGGMASKVTISRRGDPARLTLARFRCSSGGAEQRGATLTQACLRLHRESPD